MNQKTIVITGATGVLGNLVAKTFAERGDNIVLLNRDQVKIGFPDCEFESTIA